MANLIERFLSRVGREGSYGWDADLNDTYSGTDAIKHDAPNASESMASYLGINISSKDLLAGFGNWVGTTFGRQFQLFGQNPMNKQQPGMNLAVAAQPMGVNVFVGAPVFNQPIVAGGEGNAAPPAQSSGTNITANVGGKDAKEANEKKKTGEKTSAEKAEALDNAVNAALEKPQEGYEPADWKNMVEDAKKTAEAVARDKKTDPDDEFNHIMSEVPRPPSGEDVTDAQKADFVRNLGEWRAKYIGRVDDSKAATRLVDDVAGTDEKSLKLKHVEPKSKKDKQLEKQGVRKFKVEGESKDYGLKDGETVYYVTGQDKEGNTRSVWTRDYKSKDAVISSLKVGGGTDEIKLGGSTDFIEVKPEGLVKAQKTDQGHEPIYTRYKAGESQGETSSGIRAGNQDLYRDGAGVWYMKDKSGVFQKIEGEPELVGGRLYFNDAGVKLDSARADNVGEYFEDIDAAARAQTVRTADSIEAEEKLAKERVSKVEAAFDEAVGDGAKDKIKFEYDAASDSVSVSCDSKNGRAVLDAMKVEGDDNAERQYLFNDILKDLPAGADVKFNGEKIVLGDAPIKGFVTALKGQEHKPVAINGGKIDLSEMKTDDEIVNELVARAKAAQENSEVGNVSEITISDEVIFPESFKTNGVDDKDVILDTKHVKDIAYKLSEKFGYVPVSFGHASRKGDPETSYFVTGLTKSEVETRKQNAEKQAAAAAKNPPKPKSDKSVASATEQGVPAPKVDDKPASSPPQPVTKPQPDKPGELSRKSGFTLTDVRDVDSFDRGAGPLPPMLSAEEPKAAPAPQSQSSVVASAPQPAPQPKSQPSPAAAPAVPAQAPASPAPAASTAAAGNKPALQNLPPPPASVTGPTPWLDEPAKKDGAASASPASATVSTDAPKSDPAKDAMAAFESKYSDDWYASYKTLFDNAIDAESKKKIQAKFLADLTWAHKELDAIKKDYGKKGEVQKFVRKHDAKINRTMHSAVAWKVPKDDAKAKAKQLYAEGKAYYDDGKYSNALKAFEDAYATKPNPAVLKSIAECKVQMDDYDGAIAEFEQYLGDNSVAETDKMTVRTRLEEVRALKQKGQPEGTISRPPNVSVPA